MGVCVRVCVCEGVCVCVCLMFRVYDLQENNINECLKWQILNGLVSLDMY